MSASDMIIDQHKIKTIIQSRLSQLIGDKRIQLPEVLRQGFVPWATFDEKEYLMVVFLTPEDQERLEGARSEGINPFVGLITTGKEPAAFSVNKNKYMTINGCVVDNLFTFSLGPDSTIILLNHSQSVLTQDRGKVSYKVSLAYILSYGDEITSVTIYDYLDGLLAYSENSWRSPGA